MGLNYSLDDIHKCRDRLAGKPLQPYHDPETSGSVVHAYVGEDDALHAVGRIGCDKFEETLAQVMIKRGILNALSLAQNSRIDLETGAIEPVGEPRHLGLVHVSDAGREDCIIDAYAQWPEIEEIMRGENSEKRRIYIAGGIEETPDQTNRAKRKLAEIVWKLEMEKAPALTTPQQPPAPAAAVVPAPAPAAAAPAPTPAQQEPPKPAVLKPEDAFEALRKATEMLKSQRATIEQMTKAKSEVDAKLASLSGVATPPSIKEKTAALVEAMRTHVKKMTQGKEIHPQLAAALASLDKYAAASEAEQLQGHSALEVACECSAQGAALAGQLVTLGEEAKRLREENDGLKRRVFADFDAEARMVSATKKELETHALDYSSRIDPTPPQKRQCLEPPAAAPVAAAAAPTPQTMIPEIMKILGMQ